MQIYDKRIDELKPYENNPRVNDGAVWAVENSIREFGFKVPLVIDTDGVIIAGHTHFKAAINIGLETVPCLIADDLTPEQVKAFRLADNKVSELATWDLGLLSVELDALADFDMSQFGFLDDIDPSALDEHDRGGAPSMKNGQLYDRFQYPPFSILDTTSGFWQERKRWWINTVGIRSDASREGMKTLGGAAGNTPGYYEKKAVCEREIGRELTNKEFNEKYLKDYLPKDSIIGYAADGGTLSIFDPVLCELIYYWFAPPQGTILDPFAGGSVRGIVASLTGHEYLGMDIRQEQIDANNESAQAIITDGAFPCWVRGDSRNIDTVAGGKYDMVFSCPPYADLEIYSDNSDDLSNLNYDEFISRYSEIIRKCVDRLKDNRFAVFVVGEVRDQKTGFYRNFVPDTIKAFERAGAHFYNEVILATPFASLPLRVTRQFQATRKIGKAHQNVLVFYKGAKTSAIKKDFGDVQIALSVDDGEKI